MKFDERNPFFFKSPLFCFHGNCGSLPNRFRFFLAYLVPLDVDVVPIKFHQFRIFLQSFMKFDERNPQFFLNPPFFCFHGNCGKVCPTDSDFFGLSHSTRCGCVRKHYCKKKVWSEFIIFCTLVTMTRPRF